MQELHTPELAVQWLRKNVAGTLLSDSRNVKPGDGFIAWPGAVADPRGHVADALSRGASACLVEREGAEEFGFSDARIGHYAGLKMGAGAIASEFFGSPSHQLAVVAVTGTNGKTSTAWWLAQALSALPASLALPCGVIGTLGVGRPPAADAAGSAARSGSVSPTGFTTPDPVLLQQTLRQFVDSGLKACAIEASSIGIEEHRMNATHIRVAIFTNFTQDHLDYHGSMDAYWQTKRKLFAWPGLASAVINVDDPRGAELASEMDSAELDVWTVSAQKAARLQARNITYAADGLQFEVVEGHAAQLLRTRMIGSYNVANLLGVLAAMRYLGISLEAAVQACGSLHPVPGRMECMGDEGQPIVAVDYAHSPDALAQALSALRPLATQRGGRLWCVFGCGGDRDASKRPLMGAIAAQNADQVVVTSDNPRSEKPEAIISQILLGLSKSQSVEVQSDRALAIADAVSRAMPADVILIAGKGHEESQEISGVKHPFSDRAHAQQALRIRQLPVMGAKP